jgi:Phage integrase, N-terminal SAM-like domain
MKGHIRERSPGRWAIILDSRDSQTGKRKRRWHSFAGTKRQAQIECARLVSELQSGTAVDPSRMTVATFLDRWIEHMQGQVSPRSHERYTELARKNLTPLLGAQALTRLRPEHISQAYAKALASGRRDGQGGLSARTVTPTAPGAAGSAPAGPAVADACPQPSRCRQTAQGGTQADGSARHRRHRRADRGGARHRLGRPDPARRSMWSAPR